MHQTQPLFHVQQRAAQKDGTAADTVRRNGGSSVVSAVISENKGAADKRQRQRGAEKMGEVKERERKMLSDWLPVYVCELYQFKWEVW